MLLLLLFYFTVLSSLKLCDNYDFVFWLITAYLIGGYIRLFQPRITNSIFWMMVSISLMGLSVVVAIFIFFTFKERKMKYNKWINIIASATFGILLLHSCLPAVRRFLWVDVFDAVGHYSKAHMLLYSSIVVVCVFSVACVIDLLRQRFIEKPFFIFLERKYPHFLNKNLWE